MPNKLYTPLLLGGAVLLLSSCAAPKTTNNDVAPQVDNVAITIGGSSETYEALELLTDAYSAKNEGIEFEYFPPSQTDGGIEGVKTAAIDIGGVSRPLEADEASEAIQYVSLVKTPLVMIVHNSVNGVTDITGEQIKAIYSGEIANWQELGGSDAAITLLDFTEDENEKKVLREAYLGADLDVTASAVIFTEDDELIEAAAITDFSIAAVPFEEEIEEADVTVLTIDGVEPSSENLSAGTYVMALPLGIVAASQPSPEVKAFIEFATSAEGAQILAEADYLVAEATP